MRRADAHPPSEKALSEACDWFIECRDEHIDPETLSKFYAWLKRSPENIQAYLEVSAGWAELPVSDPERRFDVDELVARARSAHDDNVVPLEPKSALPSFSARSPRWHTASWTVLAVAASVVAVVMGLNLLKSQTYSTGIGEQRTVRLSDGSTVELNALSKVRVRLEKSVRQVDLVQGQALFHVAKDRARPFIVRAGSTDVRAVGTEFDVYRRSSGTTVTVVEGQVAVDEAQAAGGSGAVATSPMAILVSAGEQVTASPKQIVRRVKPDVTAATAWTAQKLIFEDTPLAEVAEEFNRYNSRKLLLDDVLVGVQVSGVYSTSDPAALIGFLRAQRGLRVDESDQQVRVSSLK